jgi:hypothetical protein
MRVPLKESSGSEESNVDVAGGQCNVVVCVE